MIFEVNAKRILFIFVYLCIAITSEIFLEYGQCNQTYKHKAGHNHSKARNGLNVCATFLARGSFSQAWGFLSQNPLSFFSCSMKRFWIPSGTRDNSTFETFIICDESLDSVRIGAFSDRVIVRIMIMMPDMTIPLMNPKQVPPNRLSHAMKMT